MPPSTMETNITLDQARALDAVARLGSFSKAATELRRVHTAVIYAVNQLEQAVGLPVVDRSGYRATLTPLGLRVLEYARRMLEAERELMSFCEGARLGHEPTLTVVYDGLLPAKPILAAARAAMTESPSTRLALYSEFLGDVEARAKAVSAAIILSVVPLESPSALAIPLAPLPSVLVARKGHPLTKARSLTPELLAAHPFLTVRGSDKRLRMSTSELDKPSAILLSDFQAKRVALLDGMGWGWMPEYLIEADLTAGRLVKIRWGEGRHVFTPVMHLATRELGPASQAFADAVVEADLRPAGRSSKSAAAPRGRKRG